MNIKLTILSSGIGYNSNLQGIPTDWNTIYTGLKIVVRRMTIINKKTVTKLELQLYAFAEQIRLRSWIGLGYHVIPLGVFYILELLLEIPSEQEFVFRIRTILTIY